MIIVVVHKLLGKRFAGITVFPFIFLKNASSKKDTILINHEKIHLRQQLELFILPFFVWYGIEFLVRWQQYRNRYKAYRNISFEREAYTCETHHKYLSKRRMWAFLNYL